MPPAPSPSPAAGSSASASPWSPRRWLPRGVGGRLLGLALLALVLAASAGCSTLGYYAQAAGGHLSLLAAARPIDDWLADPAAGEALRERLRLARRIRAFASAELGLPDNRSYTAYADLHRSAALWNVFATPELAVELKRWCYPLFGCAGYRGYFDQAAAAAKAAELRAQGYDVAVLPVPAYSTLGWSNWLGGDPLLNTFIQWPEGELARLVFHELAHQVLYIDGDTAFNESFANAVGQVGMQRWLAAHGTPAARSAQQVADARRKDFIALLVEHRRRLQQALLPDAPEALRRSRKAEVYAQLQAAYRRLRDERWNGFAGYDRYFAQPLNNAHLAVVGAYNDLAPALEALLAQHGGDLPRFYAAARALGERPRAERDAELQTLAQRAAAAEAGP